MLYSLDRDNDFAGIFLEEARWIFVTIDKHLPVWRKLPTERHALTEIRRCFHTLKGSGRMVNALDLAELAWKVENMLNEVINGNIPVTEPMFEVVSRARNLMPTMLEAFKNHRSLESDDEVEALIAQADALAAGQARVSAHVESTDVDKILKGEQGLATDSVDLSSDLGHVRECSDEALHRSEIALQHARRIGAEIRGLRNSLAEQINLVSGEIQDLRRESKYSHPKQPLSRDEISQLVDKRISERMTWIQHQRIDFKWQLDEARRAAADSRNLAQWAFLLSALIGTGAIAALLF